jgi:hypothetical protein
MNKDGQVKTKIPTSYRNKKDVSIDGDQKKKCPSCGKPKSLIVYGKPKAINEHDPNMYYLKRCNFCKYVHITPATANSPLESGL